MVRGEKWEGLWWWEGRIRKIRVIGHETRLINPMFRFITTIPAPWNTMDVLDATVSQFYEETPATLRSIISSILIALRLGMNELMSASMEPGPSMDNQGVLLIFINRACVNKYNSST